MTRGNAIAYYMPSATCETFAKPGSCVPLRDGCSSPAQTNEIEIEARHHWTTETLACVANMRQTMPASSLVLVEPTFGPIIGHLSLAVGLLTAGPTTGAQSHPGSLCCLTCVRCGVFLQV